jgi:hypothetical protein
MYDYFLGGKTNYRADREAADQAAAAWPSVPVAARTNRAYMHRAVHELARRGFRQFLDIGTGIPTRPNLHDVAQAVAPEARVVYIDNDPIVLTHARALMQGTPEGRTAYIAADVHRPDEILSSRELTETLDLTQPVLLSLHGLCHFLPDDHDPFGIVGRLLDALPSGSALSISHITADLDPVGIAQIADSYTRSGLPAQPRSRDEVARFFDGLELLDPGIVLPHHWRPEVQVLPGPRKPAESRPVTDAEISIWVGVGVKP